MPLYEYECTACHRRTEKIQKFSDAELTVCPYCNGPLERTITAPAFQFAGGGWYKDGYGSAKPATGDKAGGESGSTTGTSGESAAPAKSADAAAPAAAPATPALATTPKS